MLEPLLAGLEQKGMCFATLRIHPEYRHAFRQHPDHERLN